MLLLWLRRADMMGGEEDGMHSEHLLDGMAMQEDGIRGMHGK